MNLRPVLLALVLTACSPEDTSTVSNEALELSEQFVAADCSPQFSYSPPQSGTRIEAAIVDADGASASRTINIHSTEGAKVGVRSALRLPGTPVPITDDFSTYVLGGLLPAGSESHNGRDHAYAYPADVVSRIFSMAPGERLSVSVQERLQAGSVIQLADHQFSVEFLGCGTLRDSANAGPLRVFRTQTYNLRAGDPNKPPQKTEVLTYLSDRTGWFVRREYAGGAYETVARSTPGLEPPSA